MWNIVILWNCIFYSCNLQNVCNLARHRSDENVKMSKTCRSIDYAKRHCCGIYFYDINCVFVCYDKKIKKTVPEFKWKLRIDLQCSGIVRKSVFLCIYEPASPKGRHLPAKCWYTVPVIWFVFLLLVYWFYECPIWIMLNSQCIQLSLLLNLWKTGQPQLYFSD